MLDEDTQERKEKFEEGQKEAIYEKDSPQKKNDCYFGHKVIKVLLQ